MPKGKPQPPRRLLLPLLLLLLLAGTASSAGVAFARARLARCAPLPLLAENLLPNASLTQQEPGEPLPKGWRAAAPGVMLGAFALDGDNRSLHLMGIGNYVETPPVPVRSGNTYCFRGAAITDSVAGSPTRARLAFHWFNTNGHEITSVQSNWQTVVLWQPDAPPAGWSPLHAAFRAPPGATSLRVRIHPASDDRIYLDVLHVQRTLRSTATDTPPPDNTASNVPITLGAWPNGKRAAVSFSFDWETTMAGLIHSRSVDDPASDTDPLLRGMRMRQGITTTLALFQPYGVRATYYAAGYTLLLSNTSHTTFLGNPTYTWATRANRWQNDHWQTTPWFAPDPHGTWQTHPAWYAGDLVPPLLAAGHDIQTHTFSHFYGGFVGANDWRNDLATWNAAAATRNVAPARSLAFPWSSSGGMSNANWDALEAAGIRSLTRLSDQSQYNLFPTDAHGIVAEPRCIPLPGHERIIACPDFYLTPQSADRAIEQIARALATESGAIDLWAHTEEVVTPEQRAAWQRVVSYAAEHPAIWVAPLHEITEWQRARAQVRIVPVAQPAGHSTAPLLLRVTNGSTHTMRGLTLVYPDSVARWSIDGQQQTAPATTTETTEETMVFDIDAGQTREVRVWPAR